MFMNLSDVFSRELGYIQNETLRDIVKDTLDASPKCIATIPASATGKYHPTHSLGEGGLVRHIMAVTGICKAMFDSHIFRDMINNDDIDKTMPIEMYQDVALAACILHDCCKASDDDLNHRTLFEHPILAANLFKKTVATHLNKDNLSYLKFATPLVYKAISSHMGKWTTARYSNAVLPEPKTGLENYVHLCDYIASRRFIDFNFEKYAESQW
jgi:hypothetical protein